MDAIVLRGTLSLYHHSGHSGSALSRQSRLAYSRRLSSVAMTTKEDLRSNALNDDQSQSCRRRLILWSDCESKMSAAKSKNRIKEIIDNLKKETKWIPNVRFSRNDQSKPSCAKESEILMKEEKLLEYPYWKCCISDGSNLLDLSILQAKINEYFNTCPDCKISTIMVMVPSSEDDFRDGVEYLTGEKFASKRSNEPPFVALLQHRNQSKNDIPDWSKVRSLTTGHWELVKCFPEAEGERRYFVQYLRSRL